MAAAHKISQIRLPPLPSIKDVIKLYKLRALRELSQNFLMEPRLLDKIVRAAGHIENHVVCEVGPGPGGITRSIIKQAPRKLVLVEKDPRFIPSLELLADACKDRVDVDIITGDILKTDLAHFIPSDTKTDWSDPPPPINLIGNLPFSVSTILIIRWLEKISRQEGPWALGRARMTLTFQKEVAERMCAPMLDKQRCRLSVMCQNWCRVNYKFDIPGAAFLPKPEVDVGVVTLTPLKKPVIDLPFKLVEKVIRQIFSMRQKYSIRGAQTLFPQEVRQEMALKMYKLAEIDPVTRPFQIANSEFRRLCEAYNEIIKQYPEFENYDYRAPKNKGVEIENTI
ncbi:dimethyladenosine transferase 1, mitochondrial [Aricia agestis]|uniref:dimethyladenosine transferase 1, mitochondrial-like n=1 Tax=Aricia agestis TaxID=91739 RepID=UPI001C20986D|nr:dimethyladenosine transferase 1, mitochondrial-like [Aricia agestis]XP_041986779.1 dimethyladenosine transferase 1, mitochondrial [Aricia agestis]